ncbi:MAG: glycosyltransferase family 2 protein [Flavobacteriales bacterium]|nr:glycosyltransferase family 2 protein [Flavobacteriales bacterium]
MSTPALSVLPERPRLCVVIPCRNEHAFIERCVRSVLSADPAGCDVLVLVSDGRSDDGTREVVEALAREHPNVLLVDNAVRTTPHALNLGLQARPFDVGMILGAHAELDAGYLRECMAVLRSDLSVGCVGGLITNVHATDLSRRIGLAMAHPVGVGSAHFRTGARGGYVDTAAFGLYRREVFDRVGWFDEDLVRNQDDEFNFRVTRGGFKIFLTLKATARYHVRATYRRLWRQYFQYGYWKVFVNRKHGTVTTLRQLVPALWVQAVVLGTILLLALPVVRPWVLAVFGLYLLLTGAAAWQAGGVRDGWGVWRAFAILHAAYGTGYWIGIYHALLKGIRPTEQHKRLSR